MTEEQIIAQLRSVSLAGWTDHSLRYVKSLIAVTNGAKRVMEIGIGPEAISGQLFAMVMGKGGVLLSVDIDVNRPTAAQKAFVKSQGVAWTVRHGDSTKLLDIEPGPLDLLYIDGDHGLDHAVAEYKAFHRFVKPGGIIVFDDYPHDGVGKAVEDLGLKERGRNFQYDPDSRNGHFIVEVPKFGSGLIVDGGS